MPSFLKISGGEEVASAPSPLWAPILFLNVAVDTGLNLVRCSPSCRADTAQHAINVSMDVPGNDQNGSRTLVDTL